MATEERPQISERLRGRQLPHIGHMERDDVLDVMALGDWFREHPRNRSCADLLRGRLQVLLFVYESTRTRMGFEAAMAQLGGHAINLEDHQIGVSQREDVKDVARVTSSMCDGIVARVKAHQVLIELAANSAVPVINGLSDWTHPCQALSDLMTIHEHFGKLDGQKVAFIGDANNVARSLLSGCVKMGLSFAILSNLSTSVSSSTCKKITFPCLLSRLRLSKWHGAPPPKDRTILVFFTAESSASRSFKRKLSSPSSE